MNVVLLAIVALLTGLAIRLLRRWPRLVFAGALIGAALLGLILATAPDTQLSFVGRTLALDAGARAFLWLAIGSAAALAAFGALAFEQGADTPAAIIANSQGAFLFWSLAPIIVAIALDSFPLAVFFWAMGLIVLMLMATPRREGHAGGAAQFLLLTVVAVACLLLSNRLFDLYPLTPENTDLARNAIIFLAIGLGLMLSAVPFHLWLGPLADEMPPLGVAFLVGVAQPVGIWLLFQRMSDALWLTDQSPLLTVLVFGGAFTASIGALLAVPERRDGRFIAFLSLVSLGHALVGLGLGTRVGLAGALLMTLNRAVGVALLAGGFAFVRHHAERRWQWLGAASLLAGGFALSGILPLLGFAARWSIYRDLAASNFPLVVLLLASSAVALFATLRAAVPLFGKRAGVVETGAVKLVPYLGAAVVVLLFVIVVLTGIFPQLAADSLIAELGKAGYLK